MTPLRQRFIDDLRVRNYSPRTIATYVSVLVRFAKHFGRSPEQLNAEHIRQYQLHLLAEHASWCRFNQTTAALRVLYRITLQRDELIPRIPYGKKPKALPAVLSTDEVARLFAAVADLRQRLLLQTAYAGGLRVSEVVRLQVGDIDSSRRLLHIRAAKGRKDRLVPLSDVLLHKLRDYWRVYRPPLWLFPGHRPQQPLSIGQVQRICRLAVRAAGIRKKASMHTLRHSYATHLLESGTDLVTLQHLLGHRNISTTVRYTHIGQTHLQRIRSPLDTLLPLPLPGGQAVGGRTCTPSDPFSGDTPPKP
jgi:site-specific recombinase XerD